MHTEEKQPMVMSDSQSKVHKQSVAYSAGTQIPPIKQGRRVIGDNKDGKKGENVLGDTCELLSSVTESFIVY